MDGMKGERSGGRKDAKLNFSKNLLEELKLFICIYCCFELRSPNVVQAG